MVILKFDHNHYIPILRLRAAEMDALKLLPDNIKKDITPLIEIIPTLLEPNKSGAYKQRPFLDAAKLIGGSWGYSPVFVDLETVSSIVRPKGKSHPVKSLFEYAHELNLKLIPVTGLKRSREYNFQIQKVNDLGICVRLSSDDIRDPSFQLNLHQLLVRLQVSPGQVDILVDLKVINDQ